MISPLRSRNENVVRQIGNRFGRVEEVDSSTLGGISQSVRIRVIMDINKPMKRGTKIRIGNVEPCWIPVTYERLPSFCYWCGHLGHTFKDCESYQDMRDNGNELQDKDMPFGEWMKASPLKIVQVVPERGRGDEMGAKRNMFQQRNTERPGNKMKMGQMATEEKDVTKGTEDCGKATKKDSEDQIQELLSSLAQVEMGDDPKRQDVKQTLDQTRSPLKNQPPPDQLEANPNQVAPMKTNQNPLPIANTSSLNQSLTREKHHKPPTKPPEITHPPIKNPYCQPPTNSLPYTPLETLIAMCNNQKTTSSYTHHPSSQVPE